MTKDQELAQEMALSIIQRIHGPLAVETKSFRVGYEVAIAGLEDHDREIRLKEAEWFMKEAEESGMNPWNSTAMRDHIAALKEPHETPH